MTTDPYTMSRPGEPGASPSGGGGQVQAGGAASQVREGQMGRGLKKRQITRAGVLGAVPSPPPSPIPASTQGGNPNKQ